jgi:hypothetical protein
LALTPPHQSDEARIDSEKEQSFCSASSAVSHHESRKTAHRSGCQGVGANTAAHWRWTRESSQTEHEREHRDIRTEGVAGCDPWTVSHGRDQRGHKLLGFRACQEQSYREAADSQAPPSCAGVSGEEFSPAEEQAGGDTEENKTKHGWDRGVAGAAAV